jgi:hypothetical protein
MFEFFCKFWSVPTIGPVAPPREGRPILHYHQMMAEGSRNNWYSLRSNQKSCQLVSNLKNLYTLLCSSKPLPNYLLRYLNSIKTRSKKISNSSVNFFFQTLQTLGFYISVERSILRLFKSGHIRFPNGTVSEIWASKEDHVKSCLKLTLADFSLNC